MHGKVSSKYIWLPTWPLEASEARQARPTNTNQKRIRKLFFTSSRTSGCNFITSPTECRTCPKSAHTLTASSCQRGRRNMRITKMSQHPTYWRPTCAALATLCFSWSWRNSLQTCLACRWTHETQAKQGTGNSMAKRCGRGTCRTNRHTSFISPIVQHNSS